uniref:Uncharacterized protein n=1 Tax=Cyanothece sp. (strain PCC 7425 / ATCC 29141) TaxID=395961 RepID=B8HMC8_CYAP4
MQANNTAGVDWQEILVVLRRLLAAAQQECMPLTHEWEINIKPRTALEVNALTPFSLNFLQKHEYQDLRDDRLDSTLGCDCHCDCHC